MTDEMEKDLDLTQPLLPNTQDFIDFLWNKFHTIVTSAHLSCRHVIAVIFDLQFWFGLVWLGSLGSCNMVVVTGPATSTSYHIRDICPCSWSSIVFIPPVS